jgi:hypothetical protein
MSLAYFVWCVFDFLKFGFPSKYHQISNTQNKLKWQHIFHGVAQAGHSHKP